MSGDITAKQVSAAYSNAMRSSPEVRQRMKDYALRYLPIVKSEVLRFKMRVPKHIEFEELHGVAICGLMRAFDRYVESEANAEVDRFGAYVRKRVRGAILDELRHLDTMSRGVRRKARIYDQAVAKIEQKVGRLATEEEIRNELGLDAETFSKLLEQLRPITFFSLDDVDVNGNSSALHEHLEDANTPTAVEQAESRELFKLMRERIAELPERERKILHMYYFKDFRLAEIAEVFKVTESRVCQLHVQAVRALKAAFARQTSIPNRKT
jgi:RNA polymerase sigma factor for flagellar operon FliA